MRRQNHMYLFELGQITLMVVILVVLSYVD